MSEEEGTAFMSLETEEEPIELAPGVQTLTFEKIHDATGDCEWADDIKGEVWIDETDPDREGKTRMSLEFVFPHGTIVARGVAKKENGKKKGRFPAQGSGMYHGWQGQVRLQECNPKRWVFEPPLPTS